MNGTVNLDEIPTGTMYPTTERHPTPFAEISIDGAYLRTFRPESLRNLAEVASVMADQLEAAIAAAPVPA